MKTDDYRRKHRIHNAESAAEKITFGRNRSEILPERLHPIDIRLRTLVPSVGIR